MEERQRRSVDAVGWVPLKLDGQRSENLGTDEGGAPMIEALC